MISDWKSCYWGELATLKYGKALRGYENSSGLYPVYGTNGPIGRHSEALCKHPGVIIGRKGAYRGVHFSKTPFFVIDTAFYLEPKCDIDVKWSYYELLTHDINAMDSGSAIPSTSRDAFYHLPVKVPPFPEQQAIARILGSLDDKIELNRQMNRTLEAIAQAIFKSWFIDFDPVRAKMEGREPYGMDAETAALFPDGFEDSALGEIPRGWNTSNLGEVADNPRMVVHPKEVAFDTLYIGLEHMPRKSIALGNWGAAGNVESHKYRFNQGQVLFGKLRPYFHKVGIAIQDGVCSTDILVLDAKDPEWRNFLLFHVFSENFIKYVDGASTGTRMPRTNWPYMQNYKIVIPPPDFIKFYQERSDPLVQHIQNNLLQIHTLSTLRDTLLPKLISGQIRIREAEKIAEDGAGVEVGVGSRTMAL